MIEYALYVSSLVYRIKARSIEESIPNKNFDKTAMALKLLSAEGTREAGKATEAMFRSFGKRVKFANVAGDSEYSDCVQ